MRFIKMHGAGNDYVYVDCFHESVADPCAFARRISDRHYGIGSDGLVLIMPSTIADIRMRMFNADGSEAQMCGNAARCIGRYAFERIAHTKGKSLITLQTNCGIKTLTIHSRNNNAETVSVDMGKARFNEIPFFPVSVYQPPTSYVDMGNPHAVWFVDDLESIDIQSLGPQLEVLPCFPERANIEFAQLLNRGEIRMRVWERGSGETLACGTGACAVAATAVRNKLTDNSITMHLLGGDLKIDVGDSVILSGTATIVFEGEYYDY